jgi:hypothetical protein
MRSTKPGMLQITFVVSLEKLSRRRGASALSFMVFWTCGAKVS